MARERKILAQELRKLQALKEPVTVAFEALQDCTLEHAKLKAAHDALAIKYTREGNRLLKKYGVKTDEEINIETGAIEKSAKPEPKVKRG